MERKLLHVYLGCFVSSRRKDARKIADINFKPFTGMQRESIWMTMICIWKRIFYPLQMVVDNMKININKNCAKEWNERTSLHSMIRERNSHAIIAALNFMRCPIFYFLHLQQHERKRHEIDGINRLKCKNGERAVNSVATADTTASDMLQNEEELFFNCPLVWPYMDIAGYIKLIIKLAKYIDAIRFGYQHLIMRHTLASIWFLE